MHLRVNEVDLARSCDLKLMRLCNHAVQLPVRTVDVAMKPKLKSELERLERLKIIEKQEAPRKWVSHIVVV